MHELEENLGNPAKIDKSFDDQKTSISRINHSNKERCNSLEVQRWIGATRLGLPPLPSTVSEYMHRQ